MSDSGRKVTRRCVTTGAQSTTSGKCVGDFPARFQDKMENCQVLSTHHCRLQAVLTGPFRFGALMSLGCDASPDHFPSTDGLSRDPLSSDHNTQPHASALTFQAARRWA